MWITLLIRAWHEAIRSLFHPYRPELHYMRGPGPKWLEKHPEMAVVPVRVRSR